MGNLENAGGTSRKVPFFKAARSGDEQVVLQLLQSGVGVDSRNSHTRGALHLAAWHGHDSLVKTLIAKGAVVNAVDKHGFTAFDLAANAGHKSTVALLRKHGGEAATKCSLHGAILRRDLKAVRSLLEKGADVNVAETERFPLALALEENREAMVLAVLEYKPDMKVAESVGQSPLAVAIKAGWKLPMIQQLVELGADVNGVGRYGHTPLMEAARRDVGDIVAFLLSRGADLRAQTSDGVTALSEAIREENWEVAKNLVLAGAECDLVDVAAIGDSTLVERELQAGADVNEPDGDGERALWWSRARLGTVELMDTEIIDREL